LLTALLEYAVGGTVFLEVRTDNVAAITLYESVGFVRVGLRRRYYRASGADAYTMRRDPP
jgi:ribosomal-protein-alanine N-acetyltransferase